MKELIILKLGGSAITYKDQNIPKANIKIIQYAANDIKKARKEKEFDLIVVHGAGPFGHKFVTDFGIQNGLITNEDVEGFVRTHYSMEKLNGLIVEIFMEAGLLPFPVQPSACIIQKNKRIESFNLNIIKALLKLNADVIPVMYGDMVLDTELNASVVSGDTIISYLAKKLNADKVLFGSNIDGIYTTDPNNDKNAKLIREINSNNINSILNKVTGSKNTDVTGGMKGKLTEIINIYQNAEILVYNITEEGNINKALLGKSLECTRINLTE